MWNERNRPKFYKDQISGAPEPAGTTGWDFNTQLEEANAFKVDESDHTPATDVAPLTIYTFTALTTPRAPST